MAVNKERVRLLVDALRSGEFEQGSGMLRTRRDEYCCIGVGCEVARRNGIGIEWDDTPHVACGVSGCEEEACISRDWKFDGTSTGFSEKLMEWFGFDAYSAAGGNPKLDVIKMSGGNRYQRTMISANDDEKLDFKQIADLIEAKYLTEEQA